jgi:thioredoxin-like negative regulator of GroEL
MTWLRLGTGYRWDEGARMRGEAAGVLTVTQDQFEQVVGQEAGPLLLMFYAPWCPHCQVLCCVFQTLL